MTETRWERMTAPELRALAERNAVVILPVAALEQHGPHLPVWTDSFIGHSVAIRAAELCADLPAVVLPPMWMGMDRWRCLWVVDPWPVVIRRRLPRYCCAIKEGA